MTGRIKHYSGKSGYGFITAGNEDYFFLHTDFVEKKNGYCKVGNEVSFLPQKGSRGLHATQIKLA